jgi:hypothetical protein
MTGNFRQVLHTLAIGCMMLAATTPATASNTASASLTGLGYTLIDLAPNDGIAPSITFLNALQNPHSASNFTSYYPSESNQASTVGSGIPEFSAYDPFVRSSTLSMGGMTGSTNIGLTGPGTGQTVGLFAKATSDASGASFSSVASPAHIDTSADIALGAYGNGLRFSLGGNTQVIWFANYSVSVTSDSSNLQDIAQARVGLHGFVLGLAPNSGHLAEAFARQVFVDGTLYDADPATFNNNGGIALGEVIGNELRVTFDNTTNANRDFAIRASVDTISRSYEPMALAVPEPESYLMLTAGLGLLGFKRRRRSQMP